MDGRVAMKGWPYMYAYVGLEPIQSPECRPADTIPTPPYMHPYVHPYILTIRYKALPPNSPYTVPYTGFESLISKFQVLRHWTLPRCHNYALMPKVQKLLKRYLSTLTRKGILFHRSF
jgi:hypothetical protein